MLLKIFRGLIAGGSGKGSAADPVDAAGHAEAVALMQSGQSHDAEVRLRRQIETDPQDADAWHLLGLICHRSGRSEEAVNLIGRAVELAPEMAFMRSNFAEVLRTLGRLEQAEAQARAAVRLSPEEPDVLFNLAAVLSARHAETELLETLHLLLDIEPNHVAAHSLMAGVYLGQARFEEAIRHAEKAHQLDPGNAAMLASLIRMRASVCDWDARAQDLARLERLLDQRFAAEVSSNSGITTYLQAINPFVAYEFPLPQPLRQSVTDEHVRQVFASAGAPLAPLPAPTSKQGRRLRIGYLSADFHSHPTMHLMASFFALHDRDRFEVIAYSIGPDDGSTYRQTARESVDRFVDIRAELPRQSAERIRSDGIDILVDLKGFTHDARPTILALRAAPLQVAWLGYPASTGTGLNDYAVVDHVTVPPDLSGQFGEALIRMPHSYQVNDHRQAIADVPLRPEIGLPDDAIVFTCFNQTFKIEPEVFAIWMRILKRVPGSVLWLHGGHMMARANLAREAERHGVSPDRLRYGETMEKSRHLARLACADLFLDTGTFNAHTTASDALWAGVPVLTCAGPAFPSRVAASLVKAAGLPQLACQTWAAYEEEAVRLATDRQTLAALREHLKLHEKLPLFDTPRFVRNLEGAYQQMWERHVAGLPPVSFDVVDPSVSA